MEELEAPTRVAVAVLVALAAAVQEQEYTTVELQVAVLQTLEAVVVAETVMYLQEAEQVALE